MSSYGFSAGASPRYVPRRRISPRSLVARAFVTLALAATALVSPVLGQLADVSGS